jgi:hypothetical protein
MSWPARVQAAAQGDRRARDVPARRARPEALCRRRNASRRHRRCVMLYFFRRGRASCVTRQGRWRTLVASQGVACRALADHEWSCLCSAGSNSGLLVAAACLANKPGAVEQVRCRPSEVRVPAAPARCPDSLRRARHSSRLRRNPVPPPSHRSSSSAARSTAPMAHIRCVLPTCAAASLHSPCTCGWRPSPCCGTRT